jgi:hypothetical protein
LNTGANFRMTRFQTCRTGNTHERPLWGKVTLTASYQWLDWKKVSFVTQCIHFTKVFPFNFATHYSHTVLAWNVNFSYGHKKSMAIPELIFTKPQILNRIVRIFLTANFTPILW